MIISCPRHAFNCFMPDFRFSLVSAWSGSLESKYIRKVAIYARQSLDKEDSFSIEKQIDDCKKRIGSGVPIEEFVDKEFSGKNTDRPAFCKMMTEIRDGKIETIYCYRLDRISRSLLDFNLMWRKLQLHKCQFVSCTESFVDTTTPTREAQVQMAMLFAQHERQTIASRVKDNYYYRIKQDGRWAGGPAPYGFENAETEDEKPTLKVVENEMEIVRYCFEQYAHCPNISLGQLCRQLREKGYKSRRENGAWEHSTISRMLQSPVYAIAKAR